MNYNVVEAVMNIKRTDPDSPIIDLWEKNEDRMSEFDNFRMGAMIDRILSTKELVDDLSHDSFVQRYTSICHLMNRQHLMEDYLVDLEKRKEKVSTNLAEIEKNITSEV